MLTQVTRLKRQQFVCDLDPMNSDYSSGLRKSRRISNSETEVSTNFCFLVIGRIENRQT